MATWYFGLADLGIWGPELLSLRPVYPWVTDSVYEPMPGQQAQNGTLQRSILAIRRLSTGRITSVWNFAGLQRAAASEAIELLTTALSSVCTSVHREFIDISEKIKNTKKEEGSKTICPFPGLNRGPSVYKTDALPLS